MDFNFKIRELYFTLSISLPFKYNFSNFSNFTFSNTFISDILFPPKYNSFNSLKFTFSNILISDILFSDKFNFSNFSNLTFSNTFISDIWLNDKFNYFNSLNSILHKSFNISFPIKIDSKFNSVILVSLIFKLYFVLNSSKYLFLLYNCIYSFIG